MRRSASAILATPQMQARRSQQTGRGSFGAIPTPQAGGGMNMVPRAGAGPWAPPGGAVGGGAGNFYKAASGMPGAGIPSLPKPGMMGQPSPFGGGGMTLGAGLQNSPAMAGAVMPAGGMAAPTGGGNSLVTAASTNQTIPTGPNAPAGASSSPVGATDPWGYPTAPPLGPKIGRKGHKKFGGHGYSQRAYRKLPPWLQDPSMFNTALGSINDILGSGGKMSPERMIQEQADIEAGRGQGQQALQARLAAAGVDPSSPMYQSMAGTVDQSANRMQAENRRAEDIRSEMQKRQDLQLVMPYLQAILGFTTKHGGGGVQAAPVGGGGGGNPDYMGALSNIAGSVLGGWAQGGFQT